MPVQLSLALQGLQRAGRDMESSARRIAAGSTPTPAAPPAADSVQLFTRPEDLPVDYAAELISVLRAKTAYKADLAALSAALDAEGEAFDALEPRLEKTN